MSGGLGPLHFESGGHPCRHTAVEAVDLIKAQFLGPGCGAGAAHAGAANHQDGRILVDLAAEPLGQDAAQGDIERAVDLAQFLGQFVDLTYVDDHQIGTLRGRLWRH